MRTLILSIAALALASCGAQPLQTKEEAAVDAVMEAAADADAVTAEAETKVAEAAAADPQELGVRKDSLTGCEYLVDGTGPTPRMAFVSRQGGKYFYKHLGCNEG